MALTTDCNSRYVFADPYKGAMVAVAEAARNIVCSGGQPLGVTNCLNFGNPYDPEVYYQFVQAIKGMGDACIKFDTPVTGGNVSFYNQSPDGPVYPTPTIGMVGTLENVSEKMTLDFKKAGDIIYLIGENRNDINSSEYLHKIHGVEYSPAPYFNIEEEFHLQEVIKKLIANKLIESAHDVSEGGVLVTLLESSFNRELGFEIKTATDIRKDAFFFGESQSRVIVSINSEKETELLQTLKDAKQAFYKLGTVINSDIIIDDENWGVVSEWKDKYDNAISNLLKTHEPDQALSAL